MRPRNIAHLYRVRLRARLAQECFAVVGIAAGVALLFASQLASSSLQGSVAELSHGIAGRASLQLVGRSPGGFSQALLARVRGIPGVKVAAPLLEASAVAIGPRAREPVELVGADSSLSGLGGAFARDTRLQPFLGIGAVALPAPLARRLGVGRFGQEVLFQLAGRTAEEPFYSKLGSRQIGALIATATAIVPLGTAQEMTGLTARLSRVLIEPAPGARARVQRALEALAAGRLNVETVDYEERVFARAASVSNTSTALLSSISALVGFLFAFNAVLLSARQRRRLAGDLRRNGYSTWTVLAVLALDALALGTVSCALGLALGEELSIHVLSSNPAFFALAFPVGGERVVSWQSAEIAAGGGMLAAIVAVVGPLRTVLFDGPLGARASSERLSPAGSSARPALAGALCAGAATAILLAAPAAAVAGMLLLAAGLLLVLPLALTATLGLVHWLARPLVSIVPHVAVAELRATRARALAISATGALAIFGSVAIQGAHGDLLAGLDRAARQLGGGTDVWVSPAGSSNLLMTTPFAPVDEARLLSLPGVRSVRLYRSALLDVAGRRALVLAPPSGLPAGQLLRGASAAVTEARLRAGGWLVLSAALAGELHAHVGEEVRLPAPEPRSLRLAALSTNLGWAPGAVVMNPSDYVRAWGSDDVSAYSIQLTAGASTARVVGEIEGALDAGAQRLGSSIVGPMSVETAAQHGARRAAFSRDALASMSRIAELVPFVAVLAMAAAMGAMLVERRPRLAKLKLEGLSRSVLWRTVLFESVLLVAVGCGVGALFGLYAQQLADRVLSSTVSFPVVYSVAVPTALSSFAGTAVTVLVVLAVPGYVAASVSGALALAER